LDINQAVTAELYTPFLLTVETLAGSNTTVQGTRTSDNISLDMVKYLPTLGADVNIETKNCTSALHIMAAHKSTLFTQTLLDLGCDPLKLNKAKEDPVAIAQAKGNAAVAKLLIAARTKAQKLKGEKQTETPRKEQPNTSTTGTSANSTTNNINLPQTDANTKLNFNPNGFNENTNRDPVFDKIAHIGDMTSWKNNFRSVQ
jgi:ankyrin repeat protein